MMKVGSGTAVREERQRHGAEECRQDVNTAAHCADVDNDRRRPVRVEFLPLLANSISVAVLLHVQEQ